MASDGDVDVILAPESEEQLASFLKAWESILKPYHLIVISGSSDLHSFKLPNSIDADLYTAASVYQKLGSDISLKGLSARCLGFLVSKKRYVFVIDEGCVPAADLITGELIDPIKQHVVNLKTPSTPFFFNTLYDPYRKGTDFVRGYPFSLRTGVPTAVSSGLWLDSSPLGQGSKLKYVDAVLTVPKEVLFAMNGFNVAFDRELLGEALFLGFADKKFGSGFDYIWLGLCLKVICNHLGYGMKSGLPYVSCAFQKNDDGQKLVFLDEVFGFFSGVKLSENAKSVEDCCLEIADLIKAKLCSVDPAFEEAAHCMKSWVNTWKKHA